MVEYASIGAFLLTLLFALSNKSLSVSQLIACIFALIHYGRRWFEGRYLTRFTDERPPLLISLGCITYYWGVFGVGVMQSVMRDNYKPWYELTCKQAVIFGCFYMLFETLNFKCHMITRSLRSPGTSERGIPSGYGYGTVVMANYLWEV
jgi:very-long-chain enoyl-CoA reductase